MHRNLQKGCIFVIRFFAPEELGHIFCQITYEMMVLKCIITKINYIFLTLGLDCDILLTSVIPAPNISFALPNKRSLSIQETFHHDTNKKYQNWPPNKHLIRANLGKLNLFVVTGTTALNKLRIITRETSRYLIIKRTRFFSVYTSSCAMLQQGELRNSGIRASEYKSNARQ